MGDTYVLSGLRAKRRELAGVIIELEKQVAKLRQDLAAVESVLRLYEPDKTLERVVPKKISHRARYFRNHQLANMLRTILRDTSPQSISQIADAVMAAKEMDMGDDVLRLKLQKTVWSGLQRLAVRGSVEKIGHGKRAIWKLAPKEPDLGV